MSDTTHYIVRIKEVGKPGGIWERSSTEERCGTCKSREHAWAQVRPLPPPPIIKIKSR